MSRRRILLVGAGGHARSCIDVIEQSGEYEICGLVGLPDEVGGDVLGYPVLADDSDLPQLKEKFDVALVAAGQVESPALRVRLFDKLNALHFRMATIISPAAYVSSHAEIGQGTIVLHGAIVNAGARVGHNCIVNSRALIEHDAAVGDHCHVSTGAILNGGCRIGEGSFIGSGTVIREGVVLGSHCLVGMGLTVREDQPGGNRITSEGR